MKFSQAAAVTIAALSAAATASPNPLARRAGQCPVGYTMSTYYVTVPVTPSSSPASSSQPTTTISLTSTWTDTVTASPSPVSSAAAGAGAVSTAATTAAAPVSSAETSAVASSSVQQKQAPTTLVTSAAPATTTPVEVVSTSSTSAAPVQPTTTSSTSSTTVAPQPTTTSTSTSVAPESTSTTSSAAPQATAASSSSSSSSSVVLGSSNSGTATYYTTNGVADGTCGFSTYTLPSGIFGTALSDSNWDNAANCGACVSVTGPLGNSIKAMIVDECPGCGLNHLDLFPDAFSVLDALTVGVIDVTWEIVECGITTPLVLQNDNGASQYWFSMQVVNSNVPVQSLEVSTDGGNTWQATTRTYYNFFENTSGFGTDTVDVRVTSITGESIVVNNVSVSSGSATTASGNFQA
ncbi:hypothetical protein VTN77DRAFT_2914 [Rasamsonia byssochlamydoides]|uniref:uncharacterized protein n=1 Tax=Rasamsonia byssochlamydoides TaxID=89139 RepID=UPI003744B0DB